MVRPELHKSVVHLKLVVVLRHMARIPLLTLIIEKRRVWASLATAALVLLPTQWESQPAVVLPDRRVKPLLGWLPQRFLPSGLRGVSVPKVGEPKPLSWSRKKCPLGVMHLHAFTWLWWFALVRGLRHHPLKVFPVYQLEDGSR